MKKLANNQRYKKAGLPPGTLVHLGEKKRETISITVFEYDETHFEEWEAKSTEECVILKDEPVIHWVNVDGLHQVETMEKIGDYFGLHPLVMEDILNTGQRPKMEDYGEYIYIVAKMLYYDATDDEIVAEQQSFVVGKNYVLSFGEREGDVFNPIRERIRSGAGRIRKMGADYLAYSLLDAIVDGYFIVLEKIGDSIEYAEDRLISKPASDTLKVIRDLKRDMLYLHKSIWPLREVASALARGGETPLIGEATQVYLRDVYDHVVQAMDTTETYRDILSGMMDIYLSSISNRMNEVMKVLTIISTLFIPLTFIAGVYGMNFDYMPELSWRWGYFAVLALMVLTAGTMIVYFRKKRWF